MSKCLITDTLLLQIGDAIRAKKQISDKMTPATILSQTEEIANGLQVQHGTRSYESSGDTIPAGSFVELTMKDTSENIVAFKEYRCEMSQISTPPSDCSCSRMTDSILQISETQYITAVYESHVITENNAIKAGYVYLVLFTFDGEQLSVAAISSAISVYNFYRGEFVQYGSKYYYVVFAAAITTGANNWTGAVRTLWVHNIAITVGNNTISGTITRHSLGSLNISFDNATSFYCNTVTQDGYLHAYWDAINSETGVRYKGNVIILLTSTNTSNYYKYQTSSTEEWLPSTFVSLGNNKVLLQWDSAGVYSFSSSGYTFIDYDTVPNVLFLPYNQPSVLAYTYSSFSGRCLIKDITLASSFDSAPIVCDVPLNLRSVGSNMYVDLNTSKLWVLTRGASNYCVFVYDFLQCQYDGVYLHSYGAITNYPGVCNSYGDVFNIYYLASSGYKQKECVQLSQTKIDGLSKTELTASTPGEVYVLKGAGLAGITWSDATDEEVALMLDMHRNGEINIYDYWHIGDVRTVQLGDLNSDLAESYCANQVVDLVLVERGGKLLEDGSECVFIVQQEGLLDNLAAINISDPTIPWIDCDRRQWCNETYYNAIPETLRPVFKKHKNLTADTTTATSLVETWDYFALPAIKEITTERNNNGSVLEFNTLSGPWEYYANQEKTSYFGRDWDWWLRSLGTSTASWAYVSYSGIYSTGSTNAKGIAPFGCI